LREEGRVVQAGYVDVALVEQADLAGVARRALLEFEDSAPSAGAADACIGVPVLRAGRVRVARFVEEELSEVRARPKLTIFGPLEWRALLRGRLNGRRLQALGPDIGVEGSVPVDRRVVNRHPVRVEDVPVRV